MNVYSLLTLAQNGGMISNNELRFIFEVTENLNIKVSEMQKLKPELRKRIIEAGILHFQKEGFESTSMKDIAMDVGISIGNIYRYFLTKKHILNEILGKIENEISTFFNELPSNYNDIEIHQLFKEIIDLTVKIAKENNDTLKVLFNSQNESQFISFKEKILNMFTDKMIAIAESMNERKNISMVLCQAVAKAEFEGFTCIVKNDAQDISKLKEDLEIYEKLMMENLSKRVMEVIKG